MQFQASALTPGLSPRHAYGAMIRLHREAANMSPAALGDIIGYSRVQVSRLETAQRSIPPDLPPKLDAAFGTGGLFVMLYELVKNDVFPDFVRRFMDLEAKAVRMRKYEAATVPGLLQTREYALALLRAGQINATDDKINEDLDARMRRQIVLARQLPPHLLILLDEAVLRRPVGGDRVMAKQLAHLLTVGKSPRVLVQVVPFSHGAHGIMGGSMTLLTLDDNRQYAYLEGSHTGQLIEDVGTVAEYELSYDLLRASALTRDASAAMIRAAQEEYEACETPPA